MASSFLKQYARGCSCGGKTSGCLSDSIQERMCIMNSCPWKRMIDDIMNGLRLKLGAWTQTFNRVVIFSLICLLASTTNADTFTQAWNGNTSDTWYTPDPYTAENAVHTFKLTGVPNFGGVVWGDSFWYRVSKRLDSTSAWNELDTGGQYSSGTFSREVTVSPNNQVKFVIYSNKNKTDTDIAGVYLWSFRAPDITRPSNPTSWSGSDPIDTWTRDNDLQVKWSGASDSGTGLKGYYFKWDNSSSTTVSSSNYDNWRSDTDGSDTASKNGVADGKWYFHIRYVDNADNWASGTAHYGPFKIDRTDPDPPTLSEPIGDVQIHNLRPTLKWKAPSDTSGIAKYRLKFYRKGAIYDWFDEKDVFGTSYKLSSEEALNFDKQWGWKVYAVDNAGNSGERSSEGLFRTVNNAPPIPGNLRYDTPTRTGATVRWDRAEDPDGDDVTYVLRYDKAGFLNEKEVDCGSSLSYTITDLSGGEWCNISVKSVDSFNKTLGYSDIIQFTTPVVGSLHITVKNKGNGENIAGADLVVFRKDSGDVVTNLKTEADGVARWNDVDSGDYDVECYYNGEFWARERVKVPNSSTPGKATIVRKEPYAEWIRFFDGDTEITGGNVLVGRPVKVQVKVRNDSDATRDVSVNVWLDRDKIGAADQQISLGTKALGGSGNEAIFEKVVTFGAEGSYSRKLEVRTWTLTDAWPYGDPVLTVVSPPKPDGEIIAFSPPAAAMVERGETVSTTVKVKNNTTVTTNFWVGLSFAHQNAAEWPTGWYDVYPARTRAIQPGGTDTVTLTCMIPDGMDEGAHYAVGAVWPDGSFQRLSFAGVERIDDTRAEYHNGAWVSPGAGMKGMKAFYLPARGVISNWSAAWKIAEAFVPILNDVLRKDPSVNLQDVYDLTTIRLYDPEQAGFCLKPLVYVGVNASIANIKVGGVPVAGGSGGVGVVIDLFDLLGMTPEGEDGTVTVWLDGNIRGGIELSSTNSVKVKPTFALLTHAYRESDSAMADYRRNFNLGGYLHAGWGPVAYDRAWTITEWKCLRAGTMKDLSGARGSRSLEELMNRFLKTGGSIGAGISTKGEGLVAFEINHQSLAARMDSYEGDSPAEFAQWVVEFVLDEISQRFRWATYDDGDIVLIPSSAASGAVKNYPLNMEYVSPAGLPLDYSWIPEPVPFAHRYKFDVVAGKTYTLRLDLREKDCAGRAYLRVQKGSRPEITDSTAGATECRAGEVVEQKFDADGTYFVAVYSPESGFKNAVLSLEIDNVPVNPELYVSPTRQEVGCGSGSTTFTVANIGGGDMAWTAEVVDGGGWADVVDDSSSGNNGGTIRIRYDKNPEGSAQRTATIRVTAPGATGSPVDVQVVQDENPDYGTAVRDINGTSATITVTPSAGTSAWGVDETLPPGLTPYNLTGPNANWNAGARKISWYGTGASPATLGYCVSGAAGTYTVSGQANFDGGADVPVTGDNTFIIRSCHPADVNADWQMTMGEAVAYLAGWQRDENPMNYAIRAAYLWQKGPQYERRAGNEPMCWEVTTAPKSLGLKALSAGALDSGIQATGSGTASRTIAETTVSISVTPSAGTAAWGFEETLPAGLTPYNLSGPNANWNENSRKITWYSTGAAAATLGYTVSGADGTYSLTGLANFDGADSPVSGNTQLVIGTNPGGDDGSAVRTISGTTVTITVTPPAGTAKWGLEDWLPAGLVPDNLSGPKAQWNQGDNGVVWFGTGDAVTTLSYTVSGAPGTYEITGLVSFDDKVEHVTGDTQLVLGDSTLTVAPTSVTVPQSGGTNYFSVTANVSWSITDDADWLMVSPTSGSGDRQVTVTATSANTGTSARSATVTVTGGGITRYVTVIQQGVTSDTTPPSISITSPTSAARWTSANATMNIGGIAADNVGVASVTVRNFRDVGEYTATGTTSWQCSNLPLFQGENRITVTARDAAGNTQTSTIIVAYTGDTRYEDVLRSGSLVQEIEFPDNLTPGSTATVRWKVLSYVPVVSRVFAGVPNAWSFFRNGTYAGYEQSPWNLDGRHAGVYAFECQWPVPQHSGEFKVWFSAAQMDAYQFMISVIPDGVDTRPDPQYAKLIQRTIMPGGSGANPVSDPDTYNSAMRFEDVIQCKMRSSATVVDISMPDNLTPGTQVTVQWKVHSYVPVNGNFMLLNLEQQQIWTTVNGTMTGNPAQTTFNFRDRATQTQYFASEYTFRATFTVPNQPGIQQVYFLCQERGKTGAPWMAATIDARIDGRPAMYQGMYGRFIERTIKP